MKDDEYSSLEKRDSAELNEYSMRFNSSENGSA